MMQQHCKHCQIWSCQEPFSNGRKQKKEHYLRIRQQSLGLSPNPFKVYQQKGLTHLSTERRSEGRRQVVKIDPWKMGAGYSWGWTWGSRSAPGKQPSLGKSSEIKQDWEAVDVIMTGSKSDWRLAMRGDKQSNSVKVKQAFLVSWPN